VRAFFSYFGGRNWSFPGTTVEVGVDLPGPMGDHTKMRSAKASSFRKKAPSPEVKAYLASLPPSCRRRVQEMRAAIRAVAPGAVEGKSYGIIGYKLDHRPLVYCAGFKRHTSLFQ
jgi:hypothetical protein